MDNPKVADFWEAFGAPGEKKARCTLCPRFCVIPDKRRGFCGARENRGGKLFSIVYGRLVAMNVDPIEKKPLFHFAPGSHSLSIATAGCNLSCSFCQNWEISRILGKEIAGEMATPEEVVEAAKKHELPGIAYTYTEPLIALEFYLEVMKLAHKEGLYNIWVSNGYANPEPAKKASRHMDAINVDLKGDFEFYKKLCSVPDERPMHAALEIYRKAGVWIEITNLIIPGFNDSDKTILGIVSWVRENLGAGTPIHFSRFYPHYKMHDTQPTPVETLERAVKLARKAGMKWVYLGNVHGHRDESTICPKCNRAVVKRTGYDLATFSERCICGEEVPFAGMKWSPLKTKTSETKLNKG